MHVDSTLSCVRLERSKNKLLTCLCGNNIAGTVKQFTTGLIDHPFSHPAYLMLSFTDQSWCCIVFLNAHSVY
jgi:hypothetical protein